MWWWSECIRGLSDATVRASAQTNIRRCRSPVVAWVRARIFERSRFITYSYVWPAAAYVPMRVVFTYYLHELKLFLAGLMRFRVDDKCGLSLIQRNHANIDIKHRPMFPYGIAKTAKQKQT